jgi:leucyl aminopeptidase
VGPEKNTPNTIGASCSDGSQGRYHVDESVDAMRVSSVSGSNLRAGSQVSVDVLVWAYSQFKSDTLDVFYSSNADSGSPTWVLAGSTKPTKSGAQTLSIQHTLGSGAVQAYRAVFRYKSRQGACVPAGYTDRDDLVFSVN